MCAAAAKSLQSCPTLQLHRRQPTRLLHPWDFPGESTGVGCHCLLKQVFLSPAKLIHKINHHSSHFDHRKRPCKTVTPVNSIKFL